LKYRSYEDLFLQESIVGSGFDLTAGNRLMDFFNSNMDDIIIDMFNSTINATDPILASSPIFNPESNQRFLNDNSNHDK
jgi:hypothetical protein